MTSSGQQQTSRIQSRRSIPLLLQSDDLHTRILLTPETHSPTPDTSESTQSSELKFFSCPFFSGKLCLPSLVLALHRNIRTFCGCLGLSKTSKRSPDATNESGPLFQSKLCHRYSLFHYLWQQIQASFHPFASTPYLDGSIHHLAHTVWVQEDAIDHLQ